MGATYGFFRFLDNRASKPAKDAVKVWLKPLLYDRTAVSETIVSLFDRIYGTPLLSLRACFRSTVISVGMFLLLSLALFPDKWTDLIWGEEPKSFNFNPAKLFWSIQGIPQLLSNIVSDYLSLFVLRRWLQRASIRPVFVLVSGFIIAATIVVFFNTATHLLLSLQLFEGNVEMAVEGIYVWWTGGHATGRGEVIIGPSILITGMAVHIWLVLFAIGVTLIQLWNWFMWATGLTQWGIKGGRNRPLEAVGIVAALVVFIVTSLLHFIY